MNFGEKQKEWSEKHKKELPVWQSPKYQVAKKKAIDIISNGNYGLNEADFWILMNTTKTEKMMYSGLIISHNGCLKINDALTSRFDPSCVSLDKEGYNGSLVYTYCNAEQGIFEVGEVSSKNCKNEYPYAMAYKRLFDRVVLKLSKLAYDGIYSDSESDEFVQRFDEPKDEQQNNANNFLNKKLNVPQNADTRTFEEVEELIRLAKQKGVKEPQKALCKRFNISAISQMTKEQYAECKQGLLGMKDAE